ncbi:MAG: outer membrane lipoprotein carrier protein LolA [Sphaerochaetaceae bacterium]|nr:outer membrane lipoprotein carrier protein LolA [Sphaerochaetaceae bacterium]
MKKLSVYIVLFILCLFRIFASTSGNEYVKFGEKEIEYLKNCGVFSSSSLKGNFTQTKTVTSSGRKLESSGRVQIDPQRGIVWYTEKPYSSILIVGSTNLVQKTGSGKPVRLDMSKNRIYTHIAQAMESIFFGDFSTMQKSFNCSFAAKNGTWNIRLKPKDKILSSFISEINIEGNSQIKSLLLEEASDDSILYRFENLVPEELSSEETEIYNM